MLRPEDVEDDWVRQALINEADPAVRPAAGGRAMKPRLEAAASSARSGELEEVREARSRRRDRRAPQDRRHARQDAPGGHDRRRRCTTRPRTSRPPSSSRNSTRCGHSRSCACPAAAATRISSERQIDARREAARALAGLGGLSSPAGSRVWHVVGLQHSVRHWAIRQGWAGRPVSRRRRWDPGCRARAAGRRTTATAQASVLTRSLQHRTLNREPIDSVARKM